MKYPMKLMISGSSIAELKRNALQFLEEIGDSTPVMTGEPVVELTAADEEVDAEIDETAMVDTTGELDARGIPWIAQIHSTSRAKTKDGNWRYRRNVEDSTIKAIESKYQQAVASPFSAPPPLLQVVPSVAQPVTPNTVTPPLPAMSTQQPVALAHSFATFKANMVAVLAELVKQGKLTQEYINQLREYFQVENIWQISDTQAQMMFDNFCSLGLIQKVGV